MREHDALYQVSIPLWRNVWPGRGAIVLPGATIDDNTIVAAGSVMFDDNLADGFWRGNPATFVKPVRASDKFVRP